MGDALLVTAGPTREYLDDVRYLSNASSGRMGICLAEEALKRGIEVHLVLGPTNIKPPEGIYVYPVVSTEEMLNVCFEVYSRHLPKWAVFSAAPCDFQPKVRVQGKIKKEEEKLWLELVRTPDILESFLNLPSPPRICGFALESGNLLEQAKRKMERKPVDLLVANSPKSFCEDTLWDVHFLYSLDQVERLGNLPKREVARRILDYLLSLP